jgi:hypothetical protein
MRNTDSHIVGRYVDASGITHDVVVRKAEPGGREALDVCAEAEHVIDTLTDRQHDRPQTEAVAHDYLRPPSRARACARSASTNMPTSALCRCR